MPTKKPMFTVIVDEDVYKKIEDFQFNNRFKNRNAACNFILMAGMKALAAEYPELDLAVKLETGKKAEDDGLNEKRAHLRAQG